MNPIAKALIGMRWLAARDGLGATNHFEVGGFIRSRAGVRIPDLQFHFLPLAVSYDGSERGRAATASRPMSGRCARKSQGWVRLASATHATSRRSSSTI